MYYWSLAISDLAKYNSRAMHNLIRNKNQPDLSFIKVSNAHFPALNHGKWFWSKSAPFSVQTRKARSPSWLGGEKKKEKHCKSLTKIDKVFYMSITNVIISLCPGKKQINKKKNNNKPGHMYVYWIFSSSNLILFCCPPPPPFATETQVKKIPHCHKTQQQQLPIKKKKKRKCKKDPQM